MAKAPTSFYQICNESKETKSVDILMYGAIPTWDENSYRVKNTAEQFVNDFKNLEKDYDRINIHINSPGGSLYHSFPIYNAIKASKKDVHTYNDGLAASCAGVILLAGKTVHSAKNALLMIHNASSFVWGHAQDMRESADVLEKYDGVIADHFTQMTGKTKEEILEAYFNYKDHWFTAEEAKELGMLHEIEDYESEAAPPENIANMAFDEVMNFYHKKDEAPENIFVRMSNRLRNLFPPAENKKQDPPTPSPIPTNTDTMDFKNSLGILAKSQLSAEDVAAVKAEIEAFTGASEKFTADEVSNQVTAATAPLTLQINNLTTEKTNLATQVQTLTNEKTAIEGEKTALTTEVGNLKTDIQAYRASGVKPIQPSGANPDTIEDSGAAPDYLYSEADAEVANLRKQAGLPPRGKK